MPELTMIQAIRDALYTEMKLDKTVMVLGEDVGVDGGVFRATDGLIDEFGADRVVDTPLAESGIIGSCVGLSLNGMRPVGEIQFSGFIYPGIDHLYSAASRYRNRTRGQRTCPLVIRAPYGGGVRALEHHSESYETVYAHIPGLKTVIPSNPYDAKGLLIASIRDPDPVVFLEHKRIYRGVKQEVPAKDYTEPIGKAKIITEGDDLTIISYGAMMKFAQKAVDLVKEKGTNAELIDLRTIAPLDWETVLGSIEKTGRCIIVNEEQKSFGVAGEIAARAQEEKLLHLKAPVQRLTGFDIIYPYIRLEHHAVPNTDRIVKAIRKVLTF